MTKQQHPITPLPELVQQWYHEANLSGAPYEDVAENWAYEQHIANCAAQWGADQELEACCEWLETALVGAKPLTTELRTARRPKPPSLKEQALQALAESDLGSTEAEWSQRFDTIRRALEQLDD